MSNGRTTNRTPHRVVKITLELEKDIHRDLGKWSDGEGRSKRKQAAKLVTEHVESWRASRRQPATA